jgi:hypothetical protein
MYSKKARVESMVYLSKYENINRILLEDSNSEKFIMPPLFYLNQWVGYYSVTKSNYLDSLKKVLSKEPQENYPKFILFFDQKNLTKRLDSLKTVFPNLAYETTINPGFVDDILYRLNPRNTNQTIIIYKNKDFYK